MDVFSDLAAGIVGEGAFDADWYLEAYPDVVMLGMDPEQHYRTYGAALGRRPNGRSDLEALVIKHLETPAEGHVLVRAHDVHQAYGSGAATKVCARYLPEELSYTRHALTLADPLLRDNEAKWLSHLNAYLAHFDAAPLHLSDGPAMIDRLETDNLKSITGGPLVSVILPAFEAAKTVRAAAMSILRQTWTNLELLIVDDCSDDDTWAVLKELAATDDRVRIRRNPQNVGPYVSKNIAAREARGAWITGQDADDWSHPQRIERHLSRVLEGGPKASAGQMLRIRPNGIVDRFSPINFHVPDGITRLSPISCLLETDFFRNHLGSWDSVRFAADTELIQRILAHHPDEFEVLPVLAMLAFDGAGSLTNHPTSGVLRGLGITPVRQVYATAFRDWHANTEAGSVLPFPLLSGARPFAAPEEMVVPHDRVLRCLSGAGS